MENEPTLLVINNKIVVNALNAKFGIRHQILANVHFFVSQN